MSPKWKLPRHSGLQLSPDGWGGGKEIALQLTLTQRYLDTHLTDKAQQKDVGDDFIKKVIQVRFPFNSTELMLQKCLGAEK